SPRTVRCADGARMRSRNWTRRYEQPSDAAPPLRQCGERRQRPHANPPLRHCERSDAIQGVAPCRPGLPRRFAPRNDDEYIWSKVARAPEPRSMTPVWRNRTIGLALAAAVYALDQWIKNLALGPWRLREVGVIDLLPFFDLRWTQNFGVSLGMFEATSPEMRWALVAVTGLIALVVLVWLLRERSMWDIAGLALILGGALG